MVTCRERDNNKQKNTKHHSSQVKKNKNITKMQIRFAFLFIIKTGKNNSQNRKRVVLKEGFLLLF